MTIFFQDDEYNQFIFVVMTILLLHFIISFNFFPS